MATEFISNSWLMPTNANAEASRVSNYSLDFDGTSQYLKLDGLSNLLTNQDFTLSLWFKGTGQSTSADSSNMLFSAHGSSTSNILRIGIAKTSGGIYFAATGSSGGVVGSADYDDSNWYHLVITKPYVGGGAAGTVYINGSLIGNTETFNIDFESATHYSIGQEYDPTLSAGDFFTGKITEVSIFDYALSATQVTQLYGTGSAIGNPMAITNGRKPVAYYPLGNAGFNGEFLVPNSAEKDFVFDFDASSNNYVEVANNSSLQITDNLTLSCWINADNVSATNSIIDKFYDGADRSYLLRISGTRVKLYLGNTDGSSAPEYQSSSTLSNNVWYHVATTFSSTDNEVKIYINGSLDSTHSKTDLISSNNEELRIGTGYNLANYFDGKMSNCAVFNASLPATGTESVESLYNYGTPPNIASWSNLQGWWELDASATFDGSNWSIPDASSNSNTGTSSGMTASNLVQSDLIINAPFDSFALDFDAASSQYISIDPILKNLPSDNFSISCWVKIDTLPTGTSEQVIFQELTSASRYVRLCTKGNQNGFVLRYGDGSNLQINGATTITTNVWYNLILVYSVNDGIKLYLNGSEDASASYTSLSRSAFVDAAIGCYYYAGTALNFWDGKISNFSVYNTDLSAAQVTTLYNESKPFDLNTFEVTPVSWWRLGSVNSSFDGSNWTVLDEIGTNNGTSANMTQSDLVDGVGATGSGTSSGMSSGTNRSGSAPFSENNAVSYSMSVLAKSTSTPT